VKQKMHLSKLLTIDDILSDIKAAGREALIDRIARHMATRSNDLTKEELEYILLEREKIQSTAMGEGIAIPHGRSAVLDEPLCCLARSRQGVPFGASDGSLTYLFFTVITPESEMHTHIQVLGQISRLFGHGGMKAKLMEADNAHDMHQVLVEFDETKRKR